MLTVRPQPRGYTPPRDPLRLQVPLALFPFREGRMLRWSLIFLLIALVAAALGFGGIAAAAAGIAKILFYIFLVLFLITLIAGLAVGRRITS